MVFSDFVFIKKQVFFSDNTINISHCEFDFQFFCLRQSGHMLYIEHANAYISSICYKKCCRLNHFTNHRFNSQSFESKHSLSILFPNKLLKIFSAGAAVKSQLGGLLFPIIYAIVKVNTDVAISIRISPFHQMSFYL